ncbi:hypothetical protein AB0I81_23070 [Nonomuraea sp. NPDC050404]|uniref:hypothetical protein n=1 Tax=Nonomuraea sp. NPDC050404 TaxID=3155783 RepID=UPI0033F64099
MNCTSDPHDECPSWCTAPHYARDRRHVAEIHCVHLEPVGADVLGPRLFADLRQGPDDAAPLVHIDLDEMPILQLDPAKAIRVGWLLIELGLLGGGQP